MSTKFEGIRSPAILNVFITRCMGGGNWYGRAPIIAFKQARENEVLTVGIVYNFRSPSKVEEERFSSDEGLESLREIMWILYWSLQRQKKLREMYGTLKMCMKAFFWTDDI